MHSLKQQSGGSRHPGRPTWKVVQEIVKPATAATRCRYADLPEVVNAGAVGPAKSFGSHCWGAKWGLLVAALADHADPERTVWVDIFAVRQWPGNAADLCFDKVVRMCTSFVIACQAFPTKKDQGLCVLGNLNAEQAQARQTHLLPKEGAEGHVKVSGGLEAWALSKAA